MKSFWQEIQGKRVVLAALAAALLVCLWATFSGAERPALLASAEITNWGLSFQEEGAPPIVKHLKHLIFFTIK